MTMRAFFATILAIFLVMTAASVRAEDVPDFKTFSKALEVHEGLLTVYQDRAAGKIYLRFQGAGKDGELGRFVYAAYLRRGLGSNPVGLDRSLPGLSQILRFRRVGPRVVAEIENLGFRASGNNAAENRAVHDSFAGSILWAGKIATEDKASGQILVEVSGLLLGDVIGVARRLKAAGQGSFRLDRGRSFADPGATLVFPDNIELEAVETFAAEAPGPEVRATTPLPASLSLVAHHSLIRLPDDGYKKRLSDPRAGVIDIGFLDYSKPLAAPLHTHLARRFRLEKTDPSAARSTVKKPIIFYVDSGAPEPVRSALIEGAGWWKQAFEAAGFIDAYRVEVLPAGAHPLDARYNVINWVHRQTRGWSYGWSAADPRTGEVLKGNVLLGSQRVRQDRMILEGLVGTGPEGTGAADDALRVALARIRQLAAHEVGHALGFQHNMAASVDGRASVMDYPAPKITITDDGRLDLSDAYAVGIGAWDKAAVRYLYSQFPPGTEETAGLNKIIAETYTSGLHFVSDADSRPLSSMNPLGNLWDNGAEPVAELGHILDVRGIALAHFGPGNIAAGQPAAGLRKVIVPLYLFHRYQVTAAAKVLGGATFNYGLAGADSRPMKIADGAYQRRALAMLLRALEPAALALPDNILNLLGPGNYPEDRRGREMFGADTYPAFDALGVADVASGMVMRAILQPARIARLVEFHAREADNPGLAEVLGALHAALFATPRGEAPRLQAIRRLEQLRYVATLADLAANPATPALARSLVHAHLGKLLETVRRARGTGAARGAQRGELIRLIEGHLNRPSPAMKRPAPAPATPPGSPIGSPIGSDDGADCWHCGEPG